MSLLLGLEYDNEYDPRVQAELEQLVAAISTWSRKGDTWTDVPFVATNFSGAGSMLWTVDGGDQIGFASCVRVKTMTLTFKFSATSVGGTPSTTLLLAIPGGYSVTRKAFGTITYSDNGTFGAGTAEVYTSAPRFVQFFKADNTANWTASVNNTFITGSITFEVQRLDP